MDLNLNLSAQAPIAQRRRPILSRRSFHIQSMSSQRKEKLRRQKVPPHINQGKGDTLAQKSRESPPPQSCEVNMLIRIRRVIGSTRLHNLAARSSL
eukprot:1157904-Pelagomonas_calceolata.AAC.9